MTNTTMTLPLPRGSTPSITVSGNWITIACPASQGLSSLTISSGVAAQLINCSGVRAFSTVSLTNAVVGSLDLNAVVNITTLSLSSANITSVFLAAQLQSVSVFQLLTSVIASTLSLPSLLSVASSLSIRFSFLAALTLPALTTVRGNFAVISNPTLSSITTPALANVTGYVQLCGNTVLTRAQVSGALYNITMASVSRAVTCSETGLSSACIFFGCP
jgi:hypothetical protein